MRNRRSIARGAISAAAAVASGAERRVAPFAIHGISADPLHNLIYVVAPTNGTAPTDNLAIINGNNDTLVGNIAVPHGSAFVAVNDITNRIFVAGCNNSATPVACTVTVIDGSSDLVLRTIPVTTTPGLGLTGIAVNPFDNRVYLANASDNVVNVLDSRRLLMCTKIDLNGNSPSSIAINPFLNLLYVPFGNSQIAVVNASDEQILTTTTYGSTLVGVGVNILSGNVFVNDRNDAQTGVLDRDGGVQATVLLDASPLGVDVDPITNLAFGAENGSDTVAVINGSTNTETAAITGVPASYVSVNYFSQKVYVSGRSGVTVLTEK